MDVRYTYLLIDIATLFFPFALSFDKKVAFFKSWKYLWLPMLVTGAFFIVWDACFTQWHVWAFSDHYTLGCRLFTLPLEEWLFFIVVPYACTFIYKCLLGYFNFNKRSDWGRNVLAVLGVTLIITGLFFHNKAYTFSSFTLCGIMCLFIFFNKKRFTLLRADAFLITFIISLIPFFIVNGLLTALPVVIYNNNQNLGIRLYTIPFEDTFYGMLLMLGNIGGMEWYRYIRQLKEAQ